MIPLQEDFVLNVLERKFCKAILYQIGFADRVYQLILNFNGDQMVAIISQSTRLGDNLHRGLFSGISVWGDQVR